MGEVEEYERFVGKMEGPLVINLGWFDTLNDNLEVAHHFPRPSKDLMSPPWKDS
jgi:hypothetical protein